MLDILASDVRAFNDIGSHNDQGGVEMPRHLRLELLAGVLAATCLSASPMAQAEPVTDRLGHGDYVLAATDGGTFTEDALKGVPSAVFFGFTHCPDICPTTLGDIAVGRDVLGPEAEELRFWFVTADPERDTIDLLRNYGLGLRASPAPPARPRKWRRPSPPFGSM